MALRCLLVSLVASLGFDLPSGRDVTSWKVMGRDWAAARAVDLATLGAEASGWLGAEDSAGRPPVADAVAAPSVSVPAPEAAPTATGSAERDLVFDAVGQELAAALAADRRQLVEALVPPAPAAEAPAIEVAGLAGGEPTGRPDRGAVDLAFPAPDASATADEVADELEAQPDAPGRLSSAVRLTRDAVRAWASLMQSMGGEVLTR